VLPGAEGVEQVALVVGTAVPLEVGVEWVMRSDKVEVGVLVLLEGVGPARFGARERRVGRYLGILVQ
jgi:hypothetical protein